MFKLLSTRGSSEESSGNISKLTKVMLEMMSVMQEVHESKKGSALCRHKLFSIQVMQLAENSNQTVVPNDFSIAKNIVILKDSQASILADQLVPC